MCQLVEKQVVAVIGLNPGQLANEIASILSYVGLPLVQINPSLLWPEEKSHYDNSVNMYPSRRVISEVRPLQSADFVYMFVYVLGNN